MASSITSISQDHESTVWPVQSFVISNDFKSSGPASLLLDRANSEFGLMYHTGPGVVVMAQFPDNDEPVYFQVSKTRAACTRFNNTCKKVCILMQHCQLDLHFTTGTHAAEFLQMLGRLATKVGNLYFEVHEAPSIGALARADFNMEKEGYVNQSVQQWMAVPDVHTSEWARIYMTGKCADFSIFAGDRQFPVHRVFLRWTLHRNWRTFPHLREMDFADFVQETEQRSITLPETVQTVSTMLQEMYDVHNPTTGSIFTHFALRRAMEQDLVMSDLLALFAASDKYSLEPIKHKAADAIIDRLPFIHDPLSIVDLASCIYEEACPAMDRGLRKAIIVQLLARLPSIMEDEDSWKKYSENKAVLKALHTYQCGMLDTVSSHGLLTPPSSPTKNPMAPDVASMNSAPTTPALKASQKPPAGPNVLEVVFGSLLIKPWYPSFYPEELVGRRVERLYVCQWCFKYSKELVGFLGHLKACPLRNTPPPGVNVYKKDDYSLYEIDGEKNKMYAQNLCLFAKLFLDTKSVFYDVTTFLYYLLVAHNPTPGIPHTSFGSDASTGGIGGQGQVVGFFSKEKMSWDNNNLACILVFPPWQKQGLGQILMGASYEMSRREERLGGPEKPLSDLGRIAYIHYWSQTLARTILSCPSKKTLTVQDLRDKTYIVPEDIIATLQVMEVLEQKKRGGAEAVINKAKVRAWADTHKVDLNKHPVDPEAFSIPDRSRSGSEEA
ncbi:histone acetyltransferase MYST2 [Clathrospora elynae]|uniref:histone acetyltransferase n=1 Tax=Clathrospora elynae TaxID=706981 RepID=A0A6A5SM24_9PLEO|nr:histone acetyltransferase MYST2 [Clathrospora elynae]